jgi:hypothetical protein
MFGCSCFVCSCLRDDGTAQVVAEGVQAPDRKVLVGWFGPIEIPFVVKRAGVYFFPTSAFSASAIVASASAFRM